MDYIDYGGLHVCSLNSTVSPYMKVLERFLKHLCLSHIHCDKFENSVLSDNADHHGTLCFVVDVNKWDTSSTGLQHSAASFIEWLFRMN